MEAECAALIWLPFFITHFILFLRRFKVENPPTKSGGNTYRTDYQYDKAELLTKIRYPEALDWLQYKYDNENRVSEVVGFTASNGITYEADGALKGITYTNGVSTGYSYDSNRRLTSLQASAAGNDILKLGYTYDNANNITRIDDSGKMKTYEYDKNNQLTRSVTPGKFLEDQPTGGSYGLKIGDYLGASWMDFMPVLNGLIGLDYNSSSIGVDFGTVAPGIKKIVLIPNNAYQTHRVIERTLNLYTSTNNLTYQIIPRTNYEFVKDDKGVITITLKERLATRFLKVHVKFDERQTDFNAKDKATFLNELAKMLRVYQEATSRTEEFQYDSAGNRTLQRITLVQTSSFNSVYYTNSDRLKTDGKYAFKYDAAGNLTEKGNTYNISGDNVTFTTTGDGVEYWQYSYDLLNRLIEVKKNGTVVSEYGYDPTGLRVVKRAQGETIHYVFEGNEPKFQKNISTGKIKSYVFAGAQRLARVDGTIGDVTAKKYWYHTDHLGSVKAVTNETGKVVYTSDYLAFGSKFGQTNDARFEEDLGFTGKEMDETGLVYMNARWYDPDTGRFISEDSVNDTNNPNLYVYCANNPVNFTDPTGNYVDSDGNSHYEDPVGPSGPVYAQPASGSSGSSTPSPQTTTTYNPKSRTETITDNETGNKLAETHFDKKGNLKSTKYYNLDGSPQLEYTYNKDGTVRTCTSYSYSSVGDRTQIVESISFDRNNGTITRTKTVTNNDNTQTITKTVENPDDTSNVTVTQRTKDRKGNWTTTFWDYSSRDKNGNEKYGYQWTSKNMFNLATRGSLPSGFYADINISGGYWLGVTFGWIVDSTGAHPYLGGGIITPGASVSLTFGFGSYQTCQGWNVELSGVAPPWAGAVGYNFNNGWYGQGGLGLGKGAGLTGYYCF